MGMKLLIILFGALVIGFCIFAYVLVIEGFEEMKEAKNQKIIDSINSRAARRSALEDERKAGRYSFESDKR